MNYIKEIEHQIEVMRKYNDSEPCSDTAMAITMMAEKAFYMTIKEQTQR